VSRSIHLLRRTGSDPDVCIGRRQRPIDLTTIHGKLFSRPPLDLATASPPQLLFHSSVTPLSASLASVKRQILYPAQCGAGRSRRTPVVALGWPVVSHVFVFLFVFHFLFLFFRFSFYVFILSLLFMI
jgi:hypothetical protein